MCQTFAVLSRYTQRDQLAPLVSLVASVEQNIKSVILEQKFLEMGFIFEINLISLMNCFAIVNW